MQIVYQAHRTGLPDLGVMHKMKRQLGFILPFTLLLTVLLVGSCMVILQITNINKDSSDKNVIDTQLKQTAAAYVTSIQDTLDPSSGTSNFMAFIDTNKANLFLADLSGGPTARPDIVCKAKQGTTPALFSCDNHNRDNPASISNLLTELSGVENAPIGTPITTSSINLSPPGTSEPNTTTLSEEILGKFTMTQGSYKTQSDKAIYEVIINAELCSNTGAASRCQKYSSARNYTRTCPQSLDGKAMRPLSNAERERLNSPRTLDGSIDNSYPNLYCTCSDPSYAKTTRLGTCTLFCAPGSGVSGGSCSPCSAGQYSLGGTDTCHACPAGTYSISPTGGSCTPCPSNTYSTAIGANTPGTCRNCAAATYSAPGSSNCSSCSTGCTSCTSGSNCFSCNTGYYLNGTYCQICPTGCSACISGSSCSSCHSGYYFNNNSCLPCPANATCNGSTIVCNTGYYLNGTSCQSCDSSCATCFGGGSNQCLSCNSGSLTNGTCSIACPPGSVTGGTGRNTGVPNCSCPDNSYYWNGSSCIPCPFYSVDSLASGYSYGPTTPVGSCKCVDSQAIWSNTFQMCLFPCQNYDYGPYRCHSVGVRPDSGYFCARCSGNVCTSYTWGRDLTIDRSHCALCPPNSSC